MDSAANKAQLAANLAAWRALSEEERGKKDGMAFLFRGVEMEVSEIYFKQNLELIGFQGLPLLKMMSDFERSCVAGAG